VRDLTGHRLWWCETTAFYIFEADSTIDAVAGAVKRAFNPQTDLAVVGMPEFKSGRVVGKLDDQDIFKLVPFMKKV
jgi:hypothetical protein